MSYFDEIYIKRTNRFGDNYQSRIQGEREYLFEHYLRRSVYAIEFEYNGEVHPASFEKYKQDNTETLHYLLTRINLDIPAGTVLNLPDKDGILKPWMIYWLENIKASGYNRYVLIKMTHFLYWKNREGEWCTSWAYMYGQQNGTLRDSLKSGSGDAIYLEPTKTSFFVMPSNMNIRKDIYLEVDGIVKEAYVVTGYDFQSTEGVEYVTIDPVYLRDMSAPPTYDSNSDDNPDDYFWLNGERK